MDNEHDQPSIEGEGQARHTDPFTSKEAAVFIKAKATSARVLLLQAHASHPGGLTDEEAAVEAGLPLVSEYATRCSELKRCGWIEDTEVTRPGASGSSRLVRRITADGLLMLHKRKQGLTRCRTVTAALT